MDLDPSNQDYILELSEVFVANNNGGAAVTLLNAAKKAFPTSARIWFALGVAYLVDENRPAAEVSLRKSLELDPKLDLALVVLAQGYKETGQWNDDIEHEKFALRWGSEYLERFLVCGRSEVPCRPLFLFDSLVAKQHSKPEPFCYHPDLLRPLGRFVDGLVARAVVSRDALIAIYHHSYGWGPGEVIAVTGLNGLESQRIYKNFRRWRDTGWQRTMDEMGVTKAELAELGNQQQRHRQRFNSEAEQLIRVAQAHYRKSEPDHYPCLSRSQWGEMFTQGYGCDYRIWHLALCLDCMQTAWGLGSSGSGVGEKPRLELQVRP